MTARPVPFASVNAAALVFLPTILQRWLPDGFREGAEWVALNPRRADQRFGSFKVNLKTGKWADFACDASGGDVVSLCAYLFDLSQTEAARNMMTMMGMTA